MGNRFLQKSAFYIFVSLLLIFVYPFDFHFPTGNQCIYFFWGIKETGFGFLSNDFLATQADPFPLFSILVKYSSQGFGNNIFLFWYWLLNLVYVVAFFEIADEVSKLAGWKSPSSLEMAGVRLLLFLFLHSTLVWGFFFFHFFNFDLRWVWDSGFADQGILRGYFQPSCFGVFILLSFMYFIKRKYISAFISATIAACFHANYFLISAILIGVYVLFLFRDKNFKKAIIGSVISFLFVFPYLIYVYKNFGASTPETIEYLRTHIKGHIHFDYRVWMNCKAFLQLSLIVFSLWIIRKTVLFLPLLVSMFILVAFTLLTYLSGSIFLLNLTPWRMSIMLVPVAVAITIAYFSSIKDSKLHNVVFSLVVTILLSAIYFRVFGNNTADYLLKWRIFTVVAFIGFNIILFLSGKYLSQINLKIVLTVCCILLVFCLGLSGIVLHKENRNSEDEVLAFVKRNLSKDQQYLIQPSLIEFRLSSGAPVFVDSTIYLNNSLPEWDKRIKIINRLYSENLEERVALLDSLSENCGITHIIATNDMDFNSLKELFRNDRYIIFELNKAHLEP